MMISKAPPSSLLQSRCYRNCNRNKLNKFTIALTTATNDKKNRQEQNPSATDSTKELHTSLPAFQITPLCINQVAALSSVFLVRLNHVTELSQCLRKSGCTSGRHCSHGPRPNGSPGQLVIYSSAKSRTDSHGSL